MEDPLKLLRFTSAIAFLLSGCFLIPANASAVDDAPAPAAHGDEKSATRPPQQDFMKKVIARVNGVGITVGQVDRAVNSYIPQAVFHQSVSDEKIVNYRRQALQTLILNEILYQEAGKRGMKATDEDVDAKLKDVKEKYKGEARFEEVLKSNNLTLSDYRSMLARDLLVEKVNEVGYGTPPVVTDEDVEKYYTGNKERFMEPEKVKVSHILIKVNPSSSRQQFEELVKKAEMILKKVQEGEDFAALAREFSEDPSKEQGGDLGYVHRGRFEPEFEAAAFSMAEGEVRGLIRTIYGFHVLKVEAKTAPRQVEFAEIRDKLKKNLAEEASDKARRDWLQQLWDKATIEYFNVTEN